MGYVTRYIGLTTSGKLALAISTAAGALRSVAPHAERTLSHTSLIHLCDSTQSVTVIMCNALCFNDVDTFTAPLCNAARVLHNWKSARHPLNPNNKHAVLDPLHCCSGSPSASTAIQQAGPPINVEALMDMAETPRNSFILSPRCLTDKLR
jgi:hypothetical protein